MSRRLTASSGSRRRFSVVEGALEDNDFAVIFPEQSDFLLTADLSLDAGPPGADVNASGIGGTPDIIPAGTHVASFLVHFDSEGQPINAEEVAWSVIFEFGDEILGLIYSDGLLDASDYLGAPGTTYPTGAQYRGTTGNNEGNDSILWGQARVFQGLQSVTVEVDQIRVLVTVPEPAGVVLALSALAVLAAVRQNRP